PNYCYEVSANYKEMLDHLQAQETPQGNRFFRRVNVFRNEQEIQAAIQEFYATVQDMHELLDRQDRNYDPFYRNITKDCSWDCQFKALCLASMDGSNVDLIRNLAYEKREERPVDQFTLKEEF